MKRLRSAWLKVRDHAVAIAGAVVALIAVAWGIEYARRRIGGLKDRVTVEEARRDIAALSARRDALAESAEADEGEIEDIDRQLAENRRRIVQAHEGTADMTDSEVEAAFAGLGY